MLAEIGEQGQRRLRESGVLIVGLGGLGAPAATYLAGAGVGRIGLADNDVVSLSNLQRQTLYTENQVGMPKTDAARQRLSAMNSGVEFEAYSEGLTSGNARGIIGKYDLVVDCCDNFATRYLIDDVCAELGKPWVHGSIGEFHGQVSVFNYQQGRRYAELYAEREALCALPRTTAGVVGAVPGVVGAIEASEALKILARFGTVAEGVLFTIDLLTLQTTLITF